MSTQTFIETLVLMTCPAASCGVTYGLTERYIAERRGDRKEWLCPNGHTVWFPGKTPEQERDAAIADAKRARLSRDAARDQAAAAERSARAYRGQVTRIRNLVARGICPVAGCRRNFANMREHMATQHPDYHLHEDGAS